MAVLTRSLLDQGDDPGWEVAEWAGHSLDVLLRIYAKCLVGQDGLARRRISEALRDDAEDQHADDTGPCDEDDDQDDSDGDDG